VILLSRLNGVQFYLNPELVQTVEATPDTVITLTSHEKMVVKEPTQLVIERLMAYQREIRRRSGHPSKPGNEAGG
jgi:flagellar protein FlbD